MSPPGWTGKLWAVKQGITAAITVGMLTSLAWILLSGDTYKDVYGFSPDRSIVPFSQPGIVTIPLGFAVLIVVSLLLFHVRVPQLPMPLYLLLVWILRLNGPSYVAKNGVVQTRIPMGGVDAATNTISLGSGNAAYCR